MIVRAKLDCNNIGGCGGPIGHPRMQDISTHTAHVQLTDVISPSFFTHFVLAYDRWVLPDDYPLIEEGLRLNAKQKNPSAWPLIDYGTYYNLQSDYAKAKSMLLKAIAINPSWDREWDELSKAYRGLGDRKRSH